MMAASGGSRENFQTVSVFCASRDNKYDYEYLLTHELSPKRTQIYMIISDMLTQ